jgi:mannose-6-phosphate isomerase-like protein (cupin superfamily)
MAAAMSDYSILRAADAPDFSGDESPGAFLGYATALGAQQLGLNVRVLEPGQAHVPPGMDPTTGHSHTDIEEIYVVIEGEVTFKIGDETHVLGRLDAVRIPPEVPRGTRNDGDVDAVMVMASIKMTDPRGQSEFHPGFWDA